MQDTVAELQRLQELEITLREAKIVHAGDDDAKAQSVTDEIAQLRERIDGHWLARYDRLARHGLGVVRVVSGLCMGCNITIPVGDLNRIRSGKVEPLCPNCGIIVCFD